MVKIVLSACFAVDVDADNLRLRIHLPTQLIANNGRKKYKYVDLNDNNQKLVEQPDCVNQKVNICVAFEKQEQRCPGCVFTRRS
jgi:hypothetical protein